MSRSNHYGTVAIDSKANLMIGPWGRISHRFVASTSSPLLKIRWPQRWGDGGYSGGTGGTIRVTLQADVNGTPSGTPLSSVADYKPGNMSPGSKFLEFSFTDPYTVSAGRVYHIVFHNVDPDPTANWISVNDVFTWTVGSPRQPTMSDDYAVLSEQSGAWAVKSHYLALMDLTYENGVHDGQGYMEAMRAYVGYVTGTSSMVRQTMTVSGGDRVVSGVNVRILRKSGTQPLTVTLETSTGRLIEAVTIPADEVPLGDEKDAWQQSGNWAFALFDSAHTLVEGSTYHLRLSTGSSTTYSVIPIREGWDSGDNGYVGSSTGFRSFTFRDGEIEKTTDSGKSWTDLYAWSPVDMQFYFE